LTRRAYLAVAGVAALIAAGLIGASLVSAKADSKPASPHSSTEAASILAGIPQHGNVLGRQNAPVTLVEFADLQCPYCATWSNTAFPQIVRDYVRPGKVRIVFAGVAFLGPDSERGLRFAFAAGNQGKLWDTTHMLYAQQGAENSGWLSDNVLREPGTTIPGLDAERALRESSTVDRQLAEARGLADRAGVRGTPSFAAGPTNGKLVPVAVSSLDANALRPTLDSYLAG